MRNITTVLISFITVAVLLSVLFAFHKEAPALKTDQDEIMIDVTVPEEAKIAAQEGLPHFLGSIAQEEYGDFNFSSQEEIDNATIGNPLKYYTISSEEISSYNDDKSLMDIITPTDIVYFPVISKSQIRTILTVALENNKWEAIEIGGSNLVPVWSSTEERWPSFKGYNHYLVRTPYPYSLSFILINKTPLTRSENINPNEKTIIYYDSVIYNPSNFMSKIKHASM